MGVGGKAWKASPKGDLILTGGAGLHLNSEQIILQQPERMGGDPRCGRKACNGVFS